MSSYQQFTQDTRTNLAFMIREGYDQAEMAEKLCKHPTSISREISKNTNSTTGKYHAKRAQECTNKQKKAY